MQARRLPIVDEYLEDGRAAVYADTGVVVLLSELAAAAWEVLDDSWTSSLLIAAHLVDEFGPPGEGGAEELTDQTLRSLAEMSLVELDQGE
jgi:hypothetical protein